MSNPTCTIIGGPNGAGKTTFALERLPEIGCTNFINADHIARGLSPLNPEKRLLKASKIFLDEIRYYIQKREDFAFETTLSGKKHLKRVKQLVHEGWQVKLYYLWLSSVERSIERVIDRVVYGGHNIPREAIFRRYPKSIKNLLYEYALLPISITCLENSDPSNYILIFTKDKGSSKLELENKELYNALVEKAKP